MVRGPAGSILFGVTSVYFGRAGHESSTARQVVAGTAGPRAGRRDLVNHEIMKLSEGKNNRETDRSHELMRDADYEREVSSLVAGANRI